MLIGLHDSLGNIDTLREEMTSQFASVRSDMREDHAAMREDILELQVGMARLETRMDHVEQWLGDVEQGFSRVERILGVQSPGDSLEIP